MTFKNQPNLWAIRRRRRDQNNRLRDCLAELVVVEVVGPPDPVVRAVPCWAGQGRAGQSTNINLYPDDCWS